MVKKDPLITYEKAFFGQAGLGNVSNSTFLERKIMSTKTSIKRIALVAAAALTLGGFSVITASTANATSSATPFYVKAADAGAQTAGNQTVANTASGIAGAYNYVSLQAQTDLTAGTLGLTVSGAGSTLSVATVPTNRTDTITVAATGTSALSTGVAVTGAIINVMTPTVGTITVTVSKNVDTNGVVTTTTLQTFTITVNAASVVGAISTANSFVVRVDTSTANPKFVASIETPTVTSATADGTAALSKGTVGAAAQVSTLVVRLQDTQATPVALAGKSVTASISGVGLIAGTGILSDTASVTSYPQTPSTVASSTTDVAGWAFFAVSNAGSAGVGTVTISYTDANGVTTVVGTKSYTFYGAVASIKATQGAFIVANSASATGGTTSTTYAVQITGADSAGNPVDITGLTIDATSDATTHIATAALTKSSGCAIDDVNSSALDCTVTGTAGAIPGTVVNVTYSYTDASAVVYKSAPIKYTIGGTTISSVAATFDKASYNIGDLVTMTLTAKDSKGLVVADKKYSVFDTTTSTTVFATSAQLTTAPFASRYVTFLNGKATATFYAPYTTGDLNISATLGGTTGTAWNDLAAATAGTTVSAKVAIAGAGGDSSLAYDAASAATDAANNAYEEAQNATQAASDALAAVKALAVQVKALIALVNKIKAKLKA